MQQTRRDGKFLVTIGQIPEARLTPLAAQRSPFLFAKTTAGKWQDETEIQVARLETSTGDARSSQRSQQGTRRNFEPEFTCPHEFRLGKLGDGGKWACDPHRITTTKGAGSAPQEKDPSSCLVYSIGSNGNFDFEVEVQKNVSPNCEIHTFDLKEKGRQKDFAVEAEKAGVTFHHWGLGQKTETIRNMKTFKEMMVELKHEHRTIDLMKIDCERCEYEQFRQWLQDWKDLGVYARQVLIELHNSDLPGIVDIFKAFQEAGYVMFHKEANYINEGKAIEAAFLLLSPEFQKI